MNDFRSPYTLSSIESAPIRRRVTSVKLMSFAVLYLTVIGCAWIPAVGPDYTEPVMKSPAAWSASAKEASEESKDGVVVTPMLTWWNQFDDAELVRLVTVALQNNRDLQAAMSRVEESRALEQVATGSFFPSINASGSVTRDRISTQNLVGTGGGVSVNPGNSSSGFSNPRTNYRAGFDSSWEIDIFGGLRREREAAVADEEAAEEALRDVRLVLISEVARNYLLVRNFQKRRAIANRNIAVQRQSLDIVQARFDAGIASELDVAQAVAQLETTRAQLPTIEQGLRQALHRVGVLIGSDPGSQIEALSATDEQAKKDGFIPTPRDPINAGLPTDLLRNRPDVRQAERQLAAATARVGVAMADLFPSFTLTGSFGFSSTKSNRLFKEPSKFWSFGPGISLPIFEGGRLLGQLDAADERKKQALFKYEQTVLLALEEGENALTSLNEERKRSHSLRNALKASARAEALAQELYTRGLADFLRVLDAERVTFSAEDQLAQSESQIVINTIALFKALGGGWDIKPESASASTSDTETTVDDKTVEQAVTGTDGIANGNTGAGTGEGMKSKVATTEAAVRSKDFAPAI